MIKGVRLIILMKLHLNLADIGSSSELERPNTHHQSTFRTVLRKNVDPAIVESCLGSLDVFRDLLEGIPHQKNRVVRDVCKNLQLKQYCSGETIYDVGEKADAVYFCLTGSASICILQQKPKQQIVQPQALITNTMSFSKLNTPKTVGNSSLVSNMSASTNNQQIQYEITQQQIDLIEQGQGFGQGQFISGTKRRLKAIAKQQHTIIGKLIIDHFAQVLQNYKQRVYYKKRDMFQRCALFSKLNPIKLQFIINNTKPMSINISHKLVKQGNPVDLIYLVNKGQVSLWKTGIEINNDKEEEQVMKENKKERKQRSQSPEKGRYTGRKSNYSPQLIRSNTQVNMEDIEKIQNQEKPKKIFSSVFKLSSQKSPIPQHKHNKVFMGLISEGGFIGDMQLVLGQPHQFNAICKTQKAQIYYCDRRIIMSQLTVQDLQEAYKYYQHKQGYLNHKIDKYKNAKQTIQRQKQRDLLPPLTKDQIKLKRKIMHRHVEQKPSLIGHSSPRDIQKMIQRKQQRVKKQPQLSKYPLLQLFPTYTAKKRSGTPSSFQPLPIVQIKGKRSITEPNAKSQTTDITKNAKNPQQKAPEEMQRFNSMIIQIKPSRLDIRDVKRNRQKNMVIVGKILGRYRKCDSRIKSMEDIIQKIQKSRM